MHDPMTVAFEIRRPWPKRSSNFNGRRYWPTMATIWHVDPEKDGTDDSCGWFMRARHGDPKTLKKIEQDFAFEWSHGVPYGWFDEQEYPNFAISSIVLHMVRKAAFAVFKEDWKKTDRFVRNNLVDILSFAENPMDSMHSVLLDYYKRKHDEPLIREERVKHAAEIIYPWVLRHARPWWRQPKWHTHHWQIQIDFLQTLKRWLWSRCAMCGKRFAWGAAPVTTQWHGKGPQWFKGEQNVHHMRCFMQETRKQRVAQPNSIRTLVTGKE